MRLCHQESSDVYIPRGLIPINKPASLKSDFMEKEEALATLVHRVTEEKMKKSEEEFARNGGMSC